MTVDLKPVAPAPGPAPAPDIAETPAVSVAPIAPAPEAIEAPAAPAPPVEAPAAPAPVEPVVEAANVEAPAAPALQDRQAFTIDDFIFKEITVKVDVGNHDMPHTGILLDYDAMGFFYMKIGEKVVAINHSRIITIQVHNPVIQKPVIGPDGDIAAEHQKGIDAQKSTFVQQAQDVADGK